MAKAHAGAHATFVPVQESSFALALVQRSPPSSFFSNSARLRGRETRGEMSKTSILLVIEANGTLPKRQSTVRDPPLTWVIDGGGEKLEIQALWEAHEMMGFTFASLSGLDSSPGRLKELMACVMYGVRVRAGQGRAGPLTILQVHSTKVPRVINYQGDYYGVLATRMLEC